MPLLFDQTAKSPMVIDLVRVFRKNLKVYDNCTPNDKVVWANSGLSCIYFRCFNIIPFYAQLFMHNVEEFSRNAEILEGKYGISNDLCSDNKIAVARCLIPEESAITVPEPDLVVSMSLLCTHVSSNYDFISQHKGVPHYTMKIPFMDPERLSTEKVYRDSIFKYLSRQTDLLTTYIENKFGQAFDQEKFIKAAHDYMRCMILLEHIQKMSANTPSPMDALDFIGFFQPLTTSDFTEGGNIDLLEFYIKFFNKLQGVVEDNKKNGAQREDVRIYWEGHTLVNRSKQMKELLAGYNARVVFGSFMTPYLMEDPIWEHELPYPLTKDNFEHFLQKHNTIEKRFYIDDLENASASDLMARMLFNLNYFKQGLKYRQKVTQGFIERYDVDAVIIISAQNCRFWSMPQSQLKDFITQDLKIPCLNMEADPIDERCMSEAQMVTRMEAFMESIL